MYYDINETRARQAKHMNSYYEYRPCSATEEYRTMIDKAADIAEVQKTNVGTEYHDKIDRLLDAYARKLADNINKGFDVECRCPSIMVAGPANFPVRKKEKQNAARDKNMREWREIQGLIDKIKSTGTGGISADDPNALERLRQKQAELEVNQAEMKIANSYYRKHKTMMGYDGCTDEQAIRMDAKIKTGYSWEQCPYPSFLLTNNNANIKRIRERITGLEKLSAKPSEGWIFDGGKVVINTEINRLQILFDEKPDEIKRKEIKSHGFKWTPTQGVWQRQYTDNALRDAKKITLC